MDELLRRLPPSISVLVSVFVAFGIALVWIQQIIHRTTKPITDQVAPPPLKASGEPETQNLFTMVKQLNDRVQLTDEQRATLQSQFLKLGETVIELARSQIELKGQIVEINVTLRPIADDVKRLKDLREQDVKLTAETLLNMRKGREE